MTRLFVLHDSDETLRKRYGAREVDRAQAERLNAEGWGVFWVPNQFGKQRRLDELEWIRFWFVECDEGSKKEQVERLRTSPLLPSVVVESARGYHAYWRALDATTTRWKRIVRWGLVPALRGDPKATDPLRLLRCPGFLHCKDPEHPYPVRVVWRTDSAYTERQMLSAYRGQEMSRGQETRRVAGPEGGGRFWEQVGQLDCREALARLSGHWLCKGERFELREQPNGNANIVRSGDGYGTGSFVDARGRLGNVEAGASIAAWIAWYGHDWRTIATELRKLYPELRADDGYSDDGDGTAADGSCADESGQAAGGAGEGQARQAQAVAADAREAGAAQLPRTPRDAGADPVPAGG